MRVASGTGKGRSLKVPQSGLVRPTSDKVKQALFNILQEKTQDAVLLDLYAGTGSIGIEALSRGADRVVFVDDLRESVLAIKQNIDRAGFGERATVVPGKAESFIKKTTEQFDLVFLDPPYVVELLPLLILVSESRLLRSCAVVIAEHFKKQVSPERAGRLSLYREAVYGDTVLAFYRVAADGAE